MMQVITDTNQSTIHPKAKHISQMNTIKAL